MSKTIRVEDYRAELTVDIQLADGRVWTVRPPTAGDRQEISEIRARYLERLNVYLEDLRTRTDAFKETISEDASPVERNLRVAAFTSADPEPENISDAYATAEKLALFITPAVKPEEVLSTLDPSLAGEVWAYVESLLRGDLEAAKKWMALSES